MYKPTVTYPWVITTSSTLALGIALFNVVNSSLKITWFVWTPFPSFKSYDASISSILASFIKTLSTYNFATRVSTSINPSGSKIEKSNNNLFSSIFRLTISGSGTILGKVENTCIANILSINTPCPSLKS